MEWSDNGHGAVIQTEKESSGTAPFCWGDGVIFPALTGFQTLSGLEIGVTKVEELFAIYDALKERINETQVTQLNLADALVDGAVG